MEVSETDSRGRTGVVVSATRHLCEFQLPHLALESRLSLPSAEQSYAGFHMVFGIHDLGHGLVLGDDQLGWGAYASGAQAGRQAGTVHVGTDSLRENSPTRELEYVRRPGGKRPAGKKLGPARARSPHSAS